MVLFERFQALCFVAIAGVLVALVGCSWDSGENSGSRVSVVLPEAFADDSWIYKNACGFLRVEGPLVNVSGRVGAIVYPGTEARLYIVRNTSLDTALFTVAHCPVLMAVPVDSEQRFIFPHLPAGEYMVMLPREAFGEVQGFPIVPAVNASGLAVRTLWHGGNYAYSMCVFSVRPVEEVSAVSFP